MGVLKWTKTTAGTQTDPGASHKTLISDGSSVIYPDAVKFKISSNPVRYG
jgi:hypothetical protein